MYQTKLGRAYVGDARCLLSHLGEETVDLVLTSPPFTLPRRTACGDHDQTGYAYWLLDVCREVHRVLRPTGSLVLDLGGAYSKGRLGRSLFNYWVLRRFCNALSFRLAEEFFWCRTAGLPLPIQWVSKRRLRIKGWVNTVAFWARVASFSAAWPLTKRVPSIWWLPKGDYPKVGVRGARVADSEPTCEPREQANGLEMANADGSPPYLRLCKLARIAAHPARFPAELPAFFIALLTDPGDLVLDFFAGSNTTGAAAEAAGRHWMAVESNGDHLAASVFRFAAGMPEAEALAVYEALRSEPGAAMHIGGRCPGPAC
ncbi:MAG: site-specific DNA-methyltransferase [Candidatus Rokubacteria bacterium]|nr:site-specific DNA-methyltransferase [Candidatus Rokubacteria bacterium]